MLEVVVDIKDIKILNKVKQTLSFLPLKAVTCRNNIFQINVIDWYRFKAYFSF